MKTVTANSIQDYKTGDIVCQVKRSTTQDGSYLGIPMTLLGMANNIIFLRVEKNKYPWGEGMIVELDFERWGDVWAKYVNPEQVIPMLAESDYEKS